MASAQSSQDTWRGRCCGPKRQKLCDSEALLAPRTQNLQSCISSRIHSWDSSTLLPMLELVPDNMAGRLSVVCRAWNTAVDVAGHKQRLIATKQLVELNSGHEVTLGSPHTPWRARVKLESSCLKEPVLRFFDVINFAPGTVKAEVRPLEIMLHQSRQSHGGTKKRCVIRGDRLLLSVDGIAQRPAARFPWVAQTELHFGDFSRSTRVHEENFANRRAFHFCFF